ncbi:MAG: hypothetical protein ACP5IT_11820 [Thermoproteota archaeon]
MSSKDDKKKDDPFLERIARLETIVDTHEERLRKLESSLEDIKETLQEVLSTTKGLNFFLKNIALPILLSVITAVVLKKVF